ncbi:MULTISPECIES: homoserine O-acetyltransferase MetX [unclassified Rhodococcus (in: high G+C Gram-positive bacteria)]|uniref:homoserine O-acetyltransferase MetX n=1 Tax=unclassified Rhodococcus (in: high G+C Gram-positive bacteria) TaxID=192944 RepID=UPI0009E876C2|nr:MULTISPECIES: homoserine O-acetyltransferase [unclassified Rhodococcus (in: high G+C Gram-positive bacteria)]
MTLDLPSLARSSAFPPADGRVGTVHIGDVPLESGRVVPDATVVVQRWGEVSPARDNVVLVEHALTGDSHVTGPAGPDHPSPGWWSGMVGPGAPLDTDRWCILATNVLGGCRGTTGPSSLDPDGVAWGSRFPEISIRDQVTAERMVADALGIERFASVVGGSMGGMRTLEWLASHPDRVASALVIAVGARASADQIGTQTTQIAAITGDPDWQGGDYHHTGRAPLSGLAVARRIAHLTYRTEHELDTRFGNRSQVGEDALDGGRYAVQSYLEHQAAKLAGRFDAGSYVLLTEAMNRHDVGRGRGGLETVLRSVTVPTVVGGVDSDRLYPLRQQQEIADLIPSCDGLRIISSRDGHDGFLTEPDAVATMLIATMELASDAVAPTR